MATRTERVDFKVSAQDSASGVFARIGRGLDDLKRTAGPRGPLKDVFELLRGGGAVTGLTFGAVLLKDMTQGAVRLRDELAAGKINAGQFNEQLLQSIPIFGQIRQAGLAIRELLSGEQAEVNRILTSAKAVNDILDAQIAKRKTLRDIAGEQATGLREQFNREIAAGLRGAGREAFTLQAAEQESIFGVGEKTAKRVQAATAAADAEVKVIRDRRKQVQLEIEGLDRGILDQTAAGLGIANLLTGRKEDREKGLAERREELNRLANQERAAAQRAVGDVNKINEKGLQEAESVQREFAKRREEFATQELAKTVSGAVAAAGQAASSALSSLSGLAGAFGLGGTPEQIKAQEAADDALGAARIARLNAEAAAGNKSAETEAEKLRIAREINAEKERLNKLLTDPNVADAQKRQAQEELNALPARQKAMELAKARGTGLVPAAGGEATALQSSFIAGSINRDAENKQAAIAKATTDTAKVNVKMDRTLGLMLLQLQALNRRGPVAVTR